MPCRSGDLVLYFREVMVLRGMRWGRGGVLVLSIAATLLGTMSCLSLRPFSASQDEPRMDAGALDSEAIDGKTFDARIEVDASSADVVSALDTGLDALGEGGGPTNTDAAPDTPSARRYRVFVSSTPRVGNLGGVAGADAECQRLGDLRMPAATWRAFLWTGANPSDAPETRIGVPPNGFYRMPPVGQNATIQVFPGGPTALAGNPITDIRVDEMGTYPGAVPVWIGKAQGTRCDEWTVPGAALNTVSGVSDQISTWRSGVDQGCSTQAHFYCFEQ